MRRKSKAPDSESVRFKNCEIRLREHSQIGRAAAAEYLLSKGRRCEPSGALGGGRRFDTRITLLVWATSVPQQWLGGIWWYRRFARGANRGNDFDQSSVTRVPVPRDSNLKQPRQKEASEASIFPTSDG